MKGNSVQNCVLNIQNDLNLLVQLYGSYTKKIDVYGQFSIPICELETYLSEILSNFFIPNQIDEKESMLNKNKPFVGSEILTSRRYKPQLQIILSPFTEAQLCAIGRVHSLRIVKRPIDILCSWELNKQSRKVQRFSD